MNDTIQFDELGISSVVLKAINDMGYEIPSPIQAQAIPEILKGKDITGQAQTGTGKTAAFSIPAIDLTDVSQNFTQVLVMCPTRELALQVTDEIKKLSIYKKGLRTITVYGGEAIEKQIRDLKKGAHIVVGTPGRIIDHLNRRNLFLDKLKMVVLDEADEMLNMGFREDMELILESTPVERQTILFSATMANPILSLSKKFQNNPSLIKITKKELSLPNIEQLYLDVRSNMKLDTMLQLMEIHELKLAIVFCNKKITVDEITDSMKREGITAEGLHGDIKQNMRNHIMTKFRTGNIQVLVATDVAARGIDVENVDVVFNYDLPMDVEYYVHRIGRTGRAGKSGKAFSFIGGRNDMQRLKEIEKLANIKVQKYKEPSRKELDEFKRNRITKQISFALQDENLDKYYKMVDQYEEEGVSARDIAAAFLRINMPPAPPKEVRQESERRGKGESRKDGKGESRRDGRGKSRGERSISGPMTRFFLNVGAKDRVKAGDIVGAISGEAKISGNEIGVVEIYDKFSFVEVTEALRDKVLNGMENAKIKGKKVNIEVARHK